MGDIRGLGYLAGGVAQGYAQQQEQQQRKQYYDLQKKKMQADIDFAQAQEERAGQSRQALENFFYGQRYDLGALPGVSEEIQGPPEPGLPGLIAQMRMSRPEAIMHATQAGLPAKEMFPGPQKPITVSAGQALVQPETGEVIQQQPPKPQASPEIVKLQNQLDIETDPKKRADLQKRIDKLVSISRVKVEQTPEGGFTMEYGPGEPTVGAKSAMQQAYMPMIGELQKLQDIGAFFDRDYFTYWSAAKRWGLSQASRAGVELSPDQKDFLVKRRQFTQNVELTFNEFRKRITGAQAVMREIKMLRDSAITTKGISAEEFRGAYLAYRDNLLRATRLYNAVLRSGQAPGSKEFGRTLDNMFLSGLDDSIQQRGDELAKHYPPEQVVKILRLEGYGG